MIGGRGGRGGRGSSKSFIPSYTPPPPKSSRLLNMLSPKPKKPPDSGFKFAGYFQGKPKAKKSTTPQPTKQSKGSFFKRSHTVKQSTSQQPRSQQPTTPQSTKQPKRSFFKRPHTVKQSTSQQSTTQPKRSFFKQTPKSNIQRNLRTTQNNRNNIKNSPYKPYYNKQTKRYLCNPRELEVVLPNDTQSSIIAKLNNVYFNIPIPNGTKSGSSITFTQPPPPINNIGQNAPYCHTKEKPIIVNHIPTISEIQSNISKNTELYKKIEPNYQQPRKIKGKSYKNTSLEKVQRFAEDKTSLYDTIMGKSYGTTAGPGSLKMGLWSSAIGY